MPGSIRFDLDELVAAAKVSEQTGSAELYCTLVELVDVVRSFVSEPPTLAGYDLEAAERAREVLGRG